MISYIHHAERLSKGPGIVQQIGQPAGTLPVVHHAGAAVGYFGIGNISGCDHVGIRNITGPDYAGQYNKLIFVIDHHFPGPDDFQITVGHDLNHPAGNIGLQGPAATGFAIALKIADDRSFDRRIAKGIEFRPVVADIRQDIILPPVFDAE